MDPKLYEPRDFLWTQLDPRWRWKKLGLSGLTVGGFGCATLCCTYVIDRFRKDNGLGFLYPNQVVDRATYAPDGGIYWNTVDRLTSGRVKQTFKKAGARYVLMQVDWTAPTKYPFHWVVLLDGDLCYNPLSGKIEKRSQSVWEPTGRYIYYRLA